MNEIELIEKASAYFDTESPEGRTLRLDMIMPGLMQKPGNVIEIGAGEGMTTKVLLKHTKEVGNRVVVIDPWESTVPGYGDYSYDKFIANVKGYVNLDILVRPSQHESVSKFLEGKGPFRFAFVDGIQLQHAVLSDLFLCSAFNVDVICVDDYNRNTEYSQVPAAVEKFLQGSNKYKLVQTKPLIECYLTKSY